MPRATAIDMAAGREPDPAWPAQGSSHTAEKAGAKAMRMITGEKSSRTRLPVADAVYGHRKAKKPYHGRDEHDFLEWAGLRSADRYNE
jgi:hypothetical protein